MNHKQKFRLAGIVVIFIFVSCASGLILYALKQNINLFYTPTQLLQTKIQPNQIVRLGGYVKKHSVHYDASGTGITFIVTDKQNEMLVTYRGVLPNLFREGQGVVVTGKLTDHLQLEGSEVLAKHDEKYMPVIIKKELS